MSGSLMGHLFSSTAHSGSFSPATPRLFLSLSKYIAKHPIFPQLSLPTSRLSQPRVHVSILATSLQPNSLPPLTPLYERDSRFEALRHIVYFHAIAIPYIIPRSLQHATTRVA